MSGGLRVYKAVIMTIAGVLLALLAFTIDPDRLRDDWPLVVTLGAFFIVGHFFSVPISHQRRGPIVLVNSPFAFALALYGGVGLALLLQAASFLIYGAAKRKPLNKTAFSISDHTIGLAAGGGVWLLLGGGEAAGTGTMPAILVGTAVFVIVKAALFAGWVRFGEDFPADITPKRVLRHSTAVMLMTQAVVLVIVLAADQLALLLLALLLPTGAVYIMLRSEARATIQRTEAEETARREAELRLQEHELRLQQQEVTRRLQATDRMKDDLLAMVSHELRNPLSTVLGVLRLLTAGAPLSDDERREMLEMGERQARRLRTLIEQLLLAARFEREDPNWPSAGAELVEADAAELVLQAATEAQAGQRDHPIRVECDGRLPVRVVPDSVMQILGNLLENARKYSPEGRLVRLLAGREAGHAVLAVEDDGAGIPLAERERIFERFTQLGNGHSGLGLGLYIARQLARGQGGDLVLTEARHAAGARFELRLPLWERAGAGTPLPPAVDPQAKPAIPLR